MSHPLIPAPVSFQGKGGRFTFRPRITVVCTASDIVPLVEPFRAEMMRRTRLRLEVMRSNPESQVPVVRIELVTGDQLGGLPEPLGVPPTGNPAPDERYALVVDSDEVVLRATQPVGVARGLSSLIQLVAATACVQAETISVPAAQILDAPRYAWRGLSLDVARTWFSLEELRRIIDLLALYKLNVLHLHLTDDQAWRLPFGRSTEGPNDFYSSEDLRALVAYGADRFVTIVPEVDTPGHVAALVEMRPELNTGHNQLDVEVSPGQRHQAVWLDPELPATFQVIREVLAGVAAIFPAPYVHIGGDEPRGMPHELYASYVARLRAYVRSIGKRPLGWQESARAGLGPDDIIQHWFSDAAGPPSLPREARAQHGADLALSGIDRDTAVAASVPVIVSPLRYCYFDVPYAERSADPAQVERQDRVGNRRYSPVTVSDAFAWEPASALGPSRSTHVGGVEAAIWCETISDFDDLTFLLLPRLAGVAHKAWSVPQPDSWTDHRDRLARHARLWNQDELTYFRPSTVVSP